MADYKLTLLKNNSSPCSKCIFYSRDGCKFPKHLKKECKITKGTKNGWDTTEYLDTTTLEYFKIIDRYK